MRKSWVRGMVALMGVAGMAVTLGTCSSSERPGEDTDVEGRKSAIFVNPLNNWLQYGGDSTHSGDARDERTITVNSVANLQELFAIPDAVTAPVIVNGVLYVINKARDKIVGYNAYDGSYVWESLDTTGNGFLAGGGQQGNTNTYVPTPAIDPSGNFIYAAGHDGKIHKFKLAGGQSGHESTATGWPATFTVKLANEPSVTSLTIGVASNGAPYLYVGSGGMDCCTNLADGEGHVTAINTLTGTQKVFNALCADNPAHLGLGACASHTVGIWSRAGVSFDTAMQRLIFATNEGPGYAPTSFRWSQSVLALNVDGSGGAVGQPVDNFHPTDAGQQDVGGTNTLILTNVSGFPSYPHLAVQGGHDGWLRVINLDNMSSRPGGPAPGGSDGHLSKTQLPNVIPAFSGSNKMFSSISNWRNPLDGTTWVFVNAQSGLGSQDMPSNMLGYKMVADANGKPSLALQWQRPSSKLGGGAVVANSVLYYADGTDLVAVKASTGLGNGGQNYLWKAAGVGGGVGVWKKAPVVVNGVLYYTTTSHTLLAYRTQDLALFRLAQVSSDAVGSGVWVNGARGTDGNNSGDWANGSVFHTLKESNQLSGMPSGGPFWQVFLDGTHNVKQVVLYNRTDCCMERLSHFWVSCFNLAQNWFIESDQSSFITSTANPIIPVNLNCTTSQIMIQKSNLDYLHLAEVVVIGE